VIRSRRLRLLKAVWKNAGGIGHTGCTHWCSALPPSVRALALDEDRAIAALLAAHADMARLTVELADARERRRDAARQLMALGRGTSWIAARLGVTPQAVDGFVKYKDRNQRT
jgi:hypothetical protein